MRAARSPQRELRTATLVLIGVITLSSSLSGQLPATPTAVFRASRDVVSIDVVVRDRTGAIVRDLQAGDFEIREDGRPQEILTSSFQEVDVTAAPAGAASMLQRLGSPPISRTAGAATAASDVNGRRLILLLFDLSAMEPEEVERGVQAALKYVDTQMSNADLVSVASLTWQLTVLADFTGDRTTVRDILQSLVAVDVSTGDAPGTDPAADAGADAVGVVSSVTATDARLRALRLIADALSPIAQKKALLYFTAGLGNSAQDTPAELRAATTAATRANLAIYPVDTRGLQAVIPSGPARVASRGGEGLFSGRDVNDQFNDLTASQDTMVSMASATGGRMFSGANDVNAAFTRVQQDTAAYYLLGYSSSNVERDGRFRRVQVRVRREGLRVEARAGYYGDRDFARTSRADREAQLEEQLVTPTEPSALDVRASAGWFRLEPDRFRVPIAIESLGLVQSTPAKAVELDVLATIEDEQGRTLARIRETVNVPASALRNPASLAYMSSAVLPPGDFTLKAVVRENGAGALGAARTEIHVPDLKDRSLSVSTPWLESTDGGIRRSVYVEVYDGLAETGVSTSLVVSAAFFRASVRVLEAELPETRGDRDLAKGTAAYELPLGPGVLEPGRYECQITVVDPTSGRFALMRATLDIR